MKPFLFLGIRLEDDAAAKEYEAILGCGGLAPEQLVRVRVEQNPILPLDLDNFSGIIVGGSPFNWSIPSTDKSELQKRVEKELQQLLDEVVERDFPFLGMCYGVGVLGTHQGAIIDFERGERAGSVLVHITEAGRQDNILGNIPDEFYALTAHKEAISKLPESAVLLATSNAAPVQMLKIKNNIYATQFHPELDIPGFIDRLKVYQNHGYFPPDELDETIKKVSEKPITHPRQIIRNFVELYGLQQKTL